MTQDLITICLFFRYLILAASPFNTTDGRQRDTFKFLEAHIKTTGDAAFIYSKFNVEILRIFVIIKEIKL